MAQNGSLSPVDAELAVRGAAGGCSVELSIDKGRDSRRKYGPYAASLDLERLRALSGDAQAYGRALAEMLFEADELREALTGARWAAEERGVPLRLRLWLADGAKTLHGLRWELMTLPGSSQPLCTREDILFSRFLPANIDSAARPRSTLRALAAFANADPLPAGVAPIDVPRWVEQARAGLAGMQIDWLPAQPGERCTLDSLAQNIYDHDVLFLVCHGKMIDGQGWLVLENPDGSYAPVKASDLTLRLAGARRLPRLAVLVVCESAGTSGVSAAEGVETVGAVGPLLIETGVPAVLAMQDGLTFESAARMLPALFAALQQDGVIDRAVSVGRRAILGRPDGSAPVLFMSLVSGRLWDESASSPAVEVDKPAPIVDVDEPPSRVYARAAAEVDQRELYAVLSGDAFETQDLFELCFQLGVDWDNLSGTTKSTKAIAMIRYFRSRGIYASLVEAVRAARPNIDI